MKLDDKRYNIKTPTKSENNNKTAFSKTLVVKGNNPMSF